MKTIYTTHILKSFLACRLARIGIDLGILLRCGLALLVCAAVVAPLRAGPVVDNDAGYFFDAYTDNGGIVSSSQVQISPPGTVSLIAPNTSGSFLTRPILPSSFGRWGRLTLDGSYGALGDLRVEVLNRFGLPLVPPMPPQPWNNVPIDLSGLDPAQVPGLQVRVYFSKTAQVAPTLDSLELTWQSASQLLLDKQGPAEVRAGGQIVYSIRYSVNYLRANNLVIYDTLPHYSNSLSYPTEISPTPYPDQNDNPIYVPGSATRGGLFNAGPTPIIVNGVTVPTNSVYWNLHNTDEGVTDVLEFAVRTKPGTLDGTRTTNCAYAIAANAAPVTSSCVVTTIRSDPAPSITLDGLDCIFLISDEWRSSGGTTNTIRAIARNVGTETMYKTMAYIDVSDLMDMVEDFAPPGPAGNFFHISSGGSFIASFDPDGGTGPLPSIPAIVWNVEMLSAGSAFSGSFSVKLRASPPRLQYTSRAGLTSDQTQPTFGQMTVKLPLDESPILDFVELGSDHVPYGGIAQFDLLAVNKSAVTINDLVFLNMVPTNTSFLGAWFGDPRLRTNGAKIFYSTATIAPKRWDNPPPVNYMRAPADLDVLGNDYWERYDLVPPPNPAAVTWVGCFIPRVDSSFTCTLTPPDVITSAALSFDVRVLSALDPCIDTNLVSRGLFQANERTDLNGVKAPIFPPLTSTNDWLVLVKGTEARMEAFSRITPGVLEVPGNSTCFLYVTNFGSDILTNVQAVVQLSRVSVNGEARFPSVQGFSPAAAYDADNGRLTFVPGKIAVGDFRVFEVDLGLPAGILDGTIYTVSATVTGRGVLCGPVTDTATASGEIQSSPKLQVFKRVDADLISSGGQYEYFLDYQNVGTAPSTKTWVIEGLPSRTVFVQARGNPTITTVLFSADGNLPPGALTPFVPINQNTINSHFSQGPPPVGDVWTSPFGDQTRWVAFDVDNQALSPPQFVLNTVPTVSIMVRNDENGPSAGSAGSAQGTCFPNSAAIFSSELLQAIGNQVLTCVDDSPSIVVGKSGPKIVEAGAPFEWVVTYRNNTLMNPDDMVTIIDRLPSGITFLSATHQWNDVAVANGAPGGAAVQNVVPDIGTHDGSTVLTFPIAGLNGYRGNGALRGLEGAKITLTVRSALATPCGSSVVNVVDGLATTAAETKQSSASHQVTILCPDLELLKYVSPAEVLANGTLMYQIVVVNQGGFAASDVILTDVLPPGVSYIGPVSVLPAEYHLAEPIINGRTLTWSVANGRPLTRIGRPAGEIPANSEMIIIQFNARVTNNAPPCSVLTNVASVTTPSVEGGLYPNTNRAIATVPSPELSVTKTGPDLALPGTQIAWKISWANHSLQPATGVYLVDTFPDSNRDLTNDLTFVRVDAPAGVTPYYHSGLLSTVPAFNPANPLDPANHWSSTPIPPVNRIALLVGAVAGNAGPFDAELTVDLLHPITHVGPDAGVCFTNSVTIHQAQPGCEDASDNTATAVVCTPSLDLALTKTASAQGPFPGIAPGLPITYTLNFQNSGTVLARGVRVIDTLPEGLLKGSPLDNFTVLTLVDSLGRSCRPVNHLTDLPIVGDVPVTREISGNIITWYLGSTNISDDLYYKNVQLPPGCRGSFELYVTVAETVPDNTGICNEATISATPASPDFRTEEVLNNNTSRTCVTVHRADLKVKKRGVETSSGDPEFVEFGELITYTVEYDNIGGITAQDVRILDYVPAGTTLVSVNPPPQATVTYSPNPTDPTTATSFSVRFDALTAPANSVGGIVQSNSLPSGPPRLAIVLVGQTVEVTWEAAYAGFILQKTPVLLDSNNNWTAVSAPVVAFPSNRVGVTLPIPLQACFFRLCGTPAPGCSPGTNQYFSSVQSNCFFNWSRLFVRDTVPDGSAALYSVGRGTSGNVHFDLGPDYTHVPIGPNGLDLSGVNPLYTDLVLQSEYSLTTGTNSPCLEAWQFTFVSPCSPFFTFTVRVTGSNANSCGALLVPNRISISSITPEITTTNNTDSYDMFTRLTDLQVALAVDKAAALEGESLTYTLRYLVAGPQSAPDTYLRVALPDWNEDGIADVTLHPPVLPLPLGATAYYNVASTMPPFDPNNPGNPVNGWTTTFTASANHLVFLLGDLAADNTWRSITYMATVKSGTSGRTLVSTLAGVTPRRESHCDNSGSAVTYIGRLANVHVEKTGPDCLHPGGLAIFTINFANNGNTAAVNVVVSDVLPPGLTFVSAVPMPSTVALPNLTWNNVGTNPGTLGAGETGVIIVTGRLANACTLLGQSLENVATIRTSSEQVSLADDRAEAVLNCITPDVVGLSGYVYDDQNGDCLRDPGEHGIEGVLITLTGTDACSNSVTLTTTTFPGGQYNFTGLNPGTYVVTETQPLSWFSTGDTLGMVGIGPLRGINTNLLDDVLGPITLSGGEFGLEYNFCENTVSGCLRVTNELVTCVSNGTYRYTFCATNLFNGPISFVTLLDPPPGVTFSPDIITLTTPLQPGQGQCFTVTIQGASTPSTGLCFRFGAHNTNFIQCCAIEHCLTLPQCCAEIVNDSAVPIPGQPNCYNYTFSLKNETTPPVPIRYLIVVPDPATNCFNLTPDIIFLTTPLLPGQTVTRTLKLCVTPPCPGPFCFVLSAHDTNFDLCCSVQHCLTNAPFHHRPVVFADGFDGSVHPAGTNLIVPLIIDNSIVQPNRVTVSAGTNVIRIIQAPTNGPLSVTWNNVGAGVYTLTAAAQDDFGGVWFADPATVTVGAGRPLVAGPRLLAPALAGGKVSFSMQTEAGVTCHVEYTESLSSPTWILLQSTIGDGSVLTVTDSLTNAPQRFYRVRAR